MEGEIEETKEEKSTQEPRWSGRSRKPSVRHSYDEYADSATSTHHVHHVAYNVCEVDEPSTMQETATSDHAREWKAAVDSEYNSLIENKTWKLVEFPPGRKAICCK